MTLVRASSTSLMLAALFLAVAGCNNKDSGPAPSGGTAAPGAGPKTAGPSKGHCNNAKMGFCNEFTGSQYNEAQVKQACTVQAVAFSAGMCPTDNRVGTCLVYAEQPLESVYRYYKSFPGGAAAAEQQCKGLLKGAWTAP